MGRCRTPGSRSSKRDETVVLASAVVCCFASMFVSIASADKQPATDRKAPAPAPAKSTEAKPAEAKLAEPSPTGYAWRKLSTVPYRGKQDDIHFVNAKVGWYVNGGGKIYRTTDGGETWTEQISKPGTFFRCIGFLDEKRGFAGNIGPDYFPNVSDTQALYRTEDGGVTWSPVEIAGDPVKGLCAIEVARYPFINAGNLDTKTLLVGGGRVGGPAVFISSKDEGKTWTARDISSAGQMVLDVHFFDDKHGVMASATSANVQESSALILTTDDGGATWTKAYQGTRPFELTWKISFPTRQVGYVTIQSYNPDPKASKRYVAKTTDGGKTWSEIELVDDAKVRQFGIAFLDENTGWVGAMPGGFETSDGGKTWRRVQMGNAVNKIRLVKDGDGVVGYAIGVDVYKLERAK